MSVLSLAPTFVPDTTDPVPQWLLDHPHAFAFTTQQDTTYLFDERRDMPQRPSVAPLPQSVKYKPSKTDNAPVMWDDSKYERVQVKLCVQHSRRTCRSSRCRFKNTMAYAKKCTKSTC